MAADAVSAAAAVGDIVDRPPALLLSASGERFVVDKFSRTHDSHQKLVSRSVPECDLTIDDLFRRGERVASFACVWRVLAPSAHLLGRGTHASIFRVCKDTPQKDECVAVKFGVNVDRDGRVLDGTRCDKLRAWHGIHRGEIRTMRVITETLVKNNITPHIVSYRGAIDATSNKICPALFMFLEYIPPVGTAANGVPIASFLNVSSTLPHIEDTRLSILLFKKFMFQVVFTLACLQNTFDDFRHNDLKLDNVLITPSTHATRTYVLIDKDKSRTAWRFETRFSDVRIIDFGLAWSSDGATDAGTFDGGSSRELRDAGVVARPCHLYDLHTLLSHFRPRLEHAPREFQNVVATWMLSILPQRFWDDADLVSRKWKRLTVAGQDAVQSLTEERAAAFEPALPSMVDILRGPFFEDLRVESSDIARPFHELTI